MWFTHATPKQSFHIWTAIQDRLSTCDRIKKWNPSIDTTCILCRQHPETRNHLFFSCPYSSQVWGTLMKGLLLANYSETWEDLVSLLLDHSQGRVKLFLFRYTFQTAAHSIWRERNRRRHGEKHLPSSILIKTVDKTIRNRLSTIRRQGDSKYDEGLTIWFGTRRAS